MRSSWELIPFLSKSCHYIGLLIPLITTANVFFKTNPFDFETHCSFKTKADTERPRSIGFCF